MSLARRRTRASRLDLKEVGGNYLVTTDVPPEFSMADIKIEVRGGILTISSKLKEQKEKVEKGVVVREKSQKSFKRSITVPKDIDAKYLSTDLDNGILKVTLPKKLR